MSIECGALHVVATPIGNLEDFTYRARRILSEVDLVLAEDTRLTARLLAHYEITTPLAAFHDHNERGRTPALIERLQRGESMALVSDAGTPLVSDPGYHLLRAAHAAGVPVVAIPGPSSVTAALSVSGMPAERFVFEGFLPAQRAARRERLRELAAEPRTLVFFEAPHRSVATLEDLITELGADREACVARELTKVHETVRPGTLAELSAWTQERAERQRGEFVIVVHGAGRRQVAAGEAHRVLDILLGQLPPSQAAATAAQITGAPRKELYQQALRRQQDAPQEGLARSRRRSDTDG